MSPIPKNKGFTLIELLVVIAIILLLASIALSAVNEARTRARDAKRLTEIRQLQTALDRYFLDNGHYPDSKNCGSTVHSTSWCNSVDTISPNGHWIKDKNNPDVLSEYLSMGEPIDPLDNGTAIFPENGVGNYFYLSSWHNTPYGDDWYVLVFRLENKNDLLEDMDGVAICYPDGGSRAFFNYGGNDGYVITFGVENGNC